MILRNDILLTVNSQASEIVKNDAWQSETVIAAIITAACSLLIFLIKIMHDDTKSKRKIKTTNEELKLEQHPFFQRMNVLKNNIYNSFVLKNKGKEAIFKDILWNYISISQEVLLEFVKTIEGQGKDDMLPISDFYNLSMAAFEKICQKQNTYYLTNQNYNDQDREVLAKVLVKFNVWNTENNDHIQSTLELISNSLFYANNVGKAAAILDFYTGISVHLVNNAARTLNALNGDLEGLNFKGIKL